MRRDTHCISDAARLSFNPRTRTGCDVLPAAASAELKCFNPRTARVHHSPLRAPAHRGCFQSRTRTGVTRGEVTPSISFLTHAPARVRRLFLKQAYSASQPTHGTGATGFKLVPCRFGCFNPRTCTGATRVRARVVQVQMVSTHAPARVRRLFIGLPTDPALTHAPARVRRCVHVLTPSTVLTHAPHGCDPRDPYAAWQRIVQPTHPHGCDG